ncbi:MAG: DUF1932 domain-containing protein [Pseudomonadota bacterium]
MNFPTIAIFSPGDMGHAVGQFLHTDGHRIISCLRERSAVTRQRAERAGFENVDTLAQAVDEADLILSIMPPDAALKFASDVAALLPQCASPPVFVDCNAISPDTVRGIAKTITDAGAKFIDAGIVGPPPGRGEPRFYTSGEYAPLFDELDGKGIIVRNIGAEIGQASGLKMCYASLTKGLMTLWTAGLMTAERLDLFEPLTKELAESQGHLYNFAKVSLPRLPADSGRWIGEMEQIAETYAAVGVTDGFHRGAAEVFSVMARTPFAEETRENIDPNRTLEDAIKTYAEYLNKVI